MRKTKQPPDPTHGLRDFFTNVDEPQELFSRLAVGRTLRTRILFFWGVAGVGKSSLLKMLNARGRDLGIPTALALGDDAYGEIALLDSWVSDLSALRLKCSAFAKLKQRHSDLDKRAASLADSIRRGAKLVTAAAVEGGAGLIPGAGPVLAPLAGLGAHTVMDLVEGAMTKEDVGLLRNYASDLTLAFLKDLHRHAERQRMVLMLDTYEAIPTLHRWICDIARLVHPNVLFVLAGQLPPDWDRPWNGWPAVTRIVPLTALRPEVSRQLIQRYNSTIHGAPLPEDDLERVVAFAQGVPMAATIAVRLLREAPDLTFAALEPEATHRVFEYINRGVPQRLLPLLEAAAILGRFTRDSVQALSQVPDIDSLYRELCSLPFVSPQRDGMRVNPALAGLIQGHLKLHDYPRYQTLHKRAGVIAEGRIASLSGLDTAEDTLQLLRHRFAVDQAEGFRMLAAAVTESLESSRLSFCDALLSMTAEVTLSAEHHSQVAYWHGELAYRRGESDVAARVLRSVLSAQSAPLSVRTAASLTLGRLTYQRGDLVDAATLLRDALGFMRTTGDLTLRAYCLEQLAKVERMSSAPNDALVLHNKAIAESTLTENRYDMASHLGAYGTTLFLCGKLRDAITQYEHSIRLARELGYTQFVCTGLRSMTFALLSIGRVAEATSAASESLRLASSLKDKYNVGFARFALGSSHLAAGQAEKAEGLVSEAIVELNTVEARFDLANAHVALAACYRILGKPRAAATELAAAESRLSASGFSYGRAWLEVERARFLLTRDDLPDAQVAAQRAREHAGAASATHVLALASMVTCEIHFAGQEWESLKVAVDELKRLGQTHEYPDVLAYASLYEGALLARDGDVDGAIASLWSSLELAASFNCLLAGNAATVLTTLPSRIDSEDFRRSAEIALEGIRTRWVSGDTKAADLRSVELQSRLAIFGDRVSVLDRILS